MVSQASHRAAQMFSDAGLAGSLKKREGFGAGMVSVDPVKPTGGITHCTVCASIGCCPSSKTVTDATRARPPHVCKLVFIGGEKGRDLVMMVAEELRGMAYW